MLRFVLSALLALCTHASKAQSVPVPAAHANDNRIAAGELKQSLLNLHLELVNANWFPEQDAGPSLPVYAFAEPGRPPQVPGPLIRVPQGAEVRVSLHNTLPVAMFVRGLHSHATPGTEPLHLAAGATAEVRFTASTPGTYYYYARSTKDSLKDMGLLTVTDDLPMGEGPFDVESQLEGAFIVDPPGGVVNDRIFVITMLMRGVITPPFRDFAAINGKAWPYTERLTQPLGETVRWRILNPSLSDHAMHLHGFFFQVNSVGDGELDQIYSPPEARHAVTQYLPPGATTSLSWTPERSGQWLLHCHMTAHMLQASLGPHPLEPDSHPTAHVEVAGSAGMGGLILGITVPPSDKARPAAASDLKPRQLRLLVREKPATRFSLARMGYIIQEGAGTDTSDPPPLPGAPLILTRGEPVEILVVNQLHETTSVHWHGIELESYYDGVPGWSGGSPQITPPIPPGGSFLARMTPPRAGTFIYHTHWHDVEQLTSGLYGPILVLEPGQKYNPDLDKTFLISRALPDEAGLVLLNGSPQPSPLVLKAGAKYRLRFINIGTNDSDTVVSLLNGVKSVQWRELAKDGWALPAAQSILRPARQGVTVGETHDFEFVPEHAGDELALEITSPFLQTKITQMIAVH